MLYFRRNLVYVERRIRVEGQSEVEFPEVAVHTFLGNPDASSHDHDTRSKKRANYIISPGQQIRVNDLGIKLFLNQLALFSIAYFSNQDQAIVVAYLILSFTA